MLSRIEVLRVLVSSMGRVPTIATCGLTSRELTSIEARANHLYMLNSMGLAGPIGLGLALGRSEGDPLNKTLVIEGDGGLLMGLSFLATVAYAWPRGLVLAVLDNGAHCSTGFQPTAASKLDLGAIAEGFSLPVHRASTVSELNHAIRLVNESTDPAFVHVRIGTQSAPNVGYLQPDPPSITATFTSYLLRATEKGE